MLPGDLFSFYDWGGTVDPILPALSRRPIAERTEVPYADVRATDLLWTIDALVHQQRLLPGQLAPLLALIGVRSVITGTDDDLARSDAPPPADAAAVLAAQPGFARATRAYGPSSSFTPSRPGAPISLPQVRRYDLPSGRGLVHVDSQQAPVVLDGSADGIAGLAAFNQLAAGRPLLYSGDLSAAALRDQLKRGGELVISDSNRRRAFVAGSLEQNAGPTLAPDQSVSADGIMLDPFRRGPDFQTVASYQGIASVQAPSSPQRPQFPEHAPFAAVDGSTSTAWVADPTLVPGAAGSSSTSPNRRTSATSSWSPTTTPGAPCAASRSPGARSPFAPARTRCTSDCDQSGVCASRSAASALPSRVWPRAPAESASLRFRA